jgi:hypothetical protein
MAISAKSNGENGISLETISIENEKQYRKYQLGENINIINNRINGINNGTNYQ